MAFLYGAETMVTSRRPPLLFELSPENAARAGHTVLDLLRRIEALGYDRFAELIEYPAVRRLDAVALDRQRNLLALFAGDDRP